MTTSPTCAPGWQGWAGGTAPTVRPLLVRAHDGPWIAGARAPFTYRDLGLAHATGGAIGARHIRRVGPGTVGYDWHCHDADFQFNYVIRGAASVETEDGELHLLSPGDAICQPGLHRVRELDFSPDYECIQLAVPAESPPPIAGRDAPLPARAGELDPGRRTVFHPAAAVRDRRRPLGRRELGAEALTGGRVALHLVAADAPQPPSGTGAHWICVLEGEATVCRSGGEEVALRRFDSASSEGAMFVSAGAAGLRALALTVGTGIETEGE